MRKRKRDLDWWGRKKCAPEEVTKSAVTKLHKNLIHYFMCQYLIKSEAGLPVHSEISDPVKTDKEYNACIHREYAAKLDIYEE